MKHQKNKKAHTNLLLLPLVIVLTCISCEMGTQLRDAEYPEQLIYLPAASGGWFEIDDVSKRFGDPPVPGNTFRYVADVPNNTFTIPLGVYRAGIDNVGAFDVVISANTDTINDIIAEGDTVITLLPSDEYTLDNSVNMPDGEELGKFELVIDLDFLRNNFPDMVYALGVSIESDERETNPELSTVIITIHTNIMVPIADFSFSVDGTDPNTIDFTNSSEMAEEYLWNFGDGSEVSDEESPSHTYSGAGTYTVTLTAIGITGEADQSVASMEVTIP